MVLLGTLLALGLWTWTQLLPGYLLSRALVPGVRGVERQLLALVCGFSLVPLGLFLLSCLGHVPMDWPFVLVGTSILNVAGLATLRPWRDLDLDRRDLALLAAITVACTGFILFGFRSIDAGDVITTVQHCLYVVALHGIQNDPSHSLALFDNLSGGFIHFIIHHDTEALNGFASLVYEQRLGNVPILGLPVAMLGMAGFLASAVHATLVTAYAVWLTAREAGASRGAATAATTLFTWGSHVLCGYYVNENYYALALVCVIQWAALRPATGPGLMALVGLLIGHLIGVRDTSSLFVPAAIAAAFWQPGALAQRARTFALGLGCAVATGFPWLYVNAIALGNPFTDPKIQVDSGGRVVENVFLGLKFMFKPLNWPFTDRIVRTVWLPFPTFLWLPLLVARCYGQLTLAIAALGGWRLWASPTQRRTVVLLLVFALPHWLALSLLEGIDWEQVTYVAPGLAPLAIVLALGLDALREAGLWQWRRGLATAAVFAAIVTGSLGLRHLSFPVDLRIIDRSLWPDAPPPSGGVERLRAQLTELAPLPHQPIWRVAWASRMADAVAALPRPRGVPVSDGLPVYPNQSAVVLSAFSQGISRHYEFEVAGGPRRVADTPFRTAVWVHTLTFELAAERLEVHITRDMGKYTVALTPKGTSAEPRDFTFWLNPWYPPIESVSVTLSGKPVDGLRVLPYGGQVADGEQLLIVTNYPKALVDTVEVPITVDPRGEPTHCGILVFLEGDVDGRRIETFSPAAMDLRWHGEEQSTLVVPRNLVADQLVLFSEPYCSDHVPQFGDRFGVVRGRFDGSAPVHISLDGIWSFGGD